MLHYLHFDEFLPFYISIDTICYFAFHSFKKHWALLMPGTIQKSSERAVDKIDKSPAHMKFTFW